MGRSKVSENKSELQVGVKVCIKDKTGNILLVRRSNEKYPETRGSWDIVGGRINIGSPLSVNLRREIREELGVKLESKVKLIAAQDILRLPQFPGRHIVRLTYITSVSKRPKIKLNSEATEFGWFSLKEIKKMKKSELDLYLRKLIEEKVI